MVINFWDEEAVEHTQTVLVSNEEAPWEQPREQFAPELVLRQQGCAELYPLSGTQLVGRPSRQTKPDIPISAPFVSRSHGTFITDANAVRYLSHQSTNGTFFHGQRLEDNASVTLRDGDILYILSGSETQAYTDVSMECVFSEKRKMTWHDLILSQYDDLTKLLNRKTFSAWFDSARQYSRQAGFSLYILDIDYFKSINDHYGHAFGDAALVTLAQTLEKYLNGRGKICRWGGDEIIGALFLPVQDALSLLDLVSREIRSKKILDTVQMTISIGLIDIPRFASNVQDLSDVVALADHALYHSKRAGRNRITLYRPGM